MSIEGDRYPSGMFTPGEALTASSMNDLAGQAARGQQFYSTGQLMTQGTFGTVDLSRQPVTSATNIDHPFKVYLSKDNDGWMAYVRPGTVNGRIPKISGKYMDDVKPNLLTLGDAETTYDIVVKATKGETIMFFPDDIVVEAKKRGEYSDSDLNGYISVASVTLGVDKKLESLNQFIFTSQVVSRIRAGTTTFWSWSSR